ncbi:hypothetical protein [Leptospira noguchii]|uniref:hypothetical protein n=1 Tax=Leptospira noguchii TaxID=28182 RepID=UPI0005865A35|nr:hypothetical protein [Leptospira noguchii]
MTTEDSIDRIKRRLLELVKHQNSYQRGTPLSSQIITNSLKDSSKGPVEESKTIAEALKQLVDEKLFITGKDGSIFLTDQGYKYIERNI